MMNFFDIIREIREVDCKKTLLLGNGYLQIDEYGDVFKYDSLVDKMLELKSKNMGERLSNFISDKKESNNTNLEYHLKILSDANRALDYLEHTVYCDSCNTSGKLKNDLEKDRCLLKDLILETIKEIHPRGIKNNEIFKNCSENILNFDHLYTINYDLFLYWLFLKSNELSGINKFKDGMIEEITHDESKLKLQKWSDRHPSFTVHFLHGGVHLFVDDDNNTLKIKKVQGSILNLIELINQAQNELNSYSNLMVLEGESDEKLAYINSNPYLKKCLNKFGNMILPHFNRHTFLLNYESNKEVSHDEIDKKIHRRI